MGSGKRETSSGGLVGGCWKLFHSDRELIKA